MRTPLSPDVNEALLSTYKLLFDRDVCPAHNKGRESSRFFNVCIGVMTVIVGLRERQNRDWTLRMNRP